MRFCPTLVAILPFAQAANIILSNDDGWAEINIRQFYEALTSTGNSVVISAPAENESGSGKSILMHYFPGVIVAKAFARLLGGHSNNSYRALRVRLLCFWKSGVWIQCLGATLQLCQFVSTETHTSLCPILTLRNL